MRLGIMQPYLFPYLGYFHVMNQVDRWVVFDTAQYIRHGWVNRNRILHPNEGWQYVVVPVRKHARETPIRDVEVATDRDWRGRIIAQLGHYRKTAPHYDRTVAFVEDCLGEETNSLLALNVRALTRVTDLLGIQVELEIFSGMDLDLPPIEEPGDWALRIAERLGATTYVNPPGADFFDDEEFRRAGIQLVLSALPPFVYECPGYEYQPNLSVIDVLMWNEVDAVKRYLDEHSMMTRPDEG